VDLETSAKSLFNDALELPADERAAFLRQACGCDTVTLARVERLLAAHGRGAAFLASPTGEVPAQGVGSILSEGPGSVIGRYTLLEQVGEGGFGVVFTAEQREPVVRRVALKIIKVGMDTRQVVARFEAERQALAVMDHPGIAKVFDAGATDSGRPYFVMELVRGEPITSYCDGVSMDIRGRLALLQQVCYAVQHAHQKGIIHRDLKPSNILVGETDGKPSPRIIDFGIAKATRGLPSDTAPITEQRQFLGTPEYMSPEQADSGVTDIDTRSDIYSLGILLYELLTGATPFDPKRLRSGSWEEMCRTIREDAPQRPSTRLQSTQELREVAARRRVEPVRLIGQVRGELDWIVMKCLEKDRSRRYETANALSLDLGRFLAGEPVLAAPPSRVYLVRTFLRRHRAQVIAVSMVFASLLTAVVGTTTFAVREFRQRMLAERRAEETNRVATFQAEMLANIDAPEMGFKVREDLLAEAEQGWKQSGVGADVAATRRTALEGLLADANFTSLALRILDHNIFEGAQATIDRRFAGEPRVRAYLLHSLARAMRGAGLFDRAMQPLTEALDIRRGLLPADDPDMLSSMYEMGRLLVSRFKPDEAERYTRAALEGRRRVLGSEHPDTLSSVYMLGYVLQRQNRFDEAERFQREALEGRRRALGNNHRNTLESVWRMGQLFAFQGRADEAEPYAREALERSREVLGNDSHQTVLAMGTMANVLQQQGMISEAEPLWREALERSRRLLGEDHRDTLFFRCKFAAMLLDRGDLDQAETYLDELTERRLRVLGPEHPDALESQRMIAALRRRQGRLEESESRYRATLEQTRRVLGPAQRETLVCARELTSLLDELGKTDEAAELRARHVGAVLEAFRGWRGEGDFPGPFAEFYALLSKVRDGGVFQRELEDAFQARYGALNPATLDNLTTLAWHLAREGRLDEAEPLAREAVRGFRSATAPSDSRPVWALETLAGILRGTDRPGEAIPLYEEAKRLSLDPAVGKMRFDVPARLGYAECLVKMERFTDAERELMECLGGLTNAARNNPGVSKPVIESLIRMYDSWHAAEPGSGHDAKAAQWRARLAGAAFQGREP
jgi:tetratricopeptide (TPR) repeat protein